MIMNVVWFEIALINSDSRNYLKWSMVDKILPVLLGKLRLYTSVYYRSLKLQEGNLLLCNTCSLTVWHCKLNAQKFPKFVSYHLSEDNDHVSFLCLMRLPAHVFVSFISCILHFVYCSLMNSSDVVQIDLHCCLIGIISSGLNHLFSPLCGNFSFAAVPWHILQPLFYM